MPKKVLEPFVRKLRQHVQANHAPGDRFMTVREAAERFGVSLQTAHKGIRRLVADGMLATAPKSGATVVALDPVDSLAGRRIVILSNNPDRRFNDAFRNGVADEIGKRRIDVDVQLNSESELDALTFGDYLIDLDADGIVALGFRRGALGFYHAIREGIDVVADIALDELPVLPVIQTDNRRHAAEAARRMLQNGKRRFLVAGYFPEGNSRHEGFAEQVRTSPNAKFAEVSYACLGDADANAALDRFFYSFDGKRAVFSCDYAANYALAAKFAQHDVAIDERNFMVYDSEEEWFHPHGAQPVAAAGPSLRTLGWRLARKLLAKWETGAFAEPLVEKV